jgi:hypothetical protein
VTVYRYLAASIIAGCSSNPSPAPNQVVVAITVDWEGAYLSQDGLDALAELRKGLGAVPITHFVSAAYLTKTPPDPTAVATIAEAIHPGDELAIHLHAWRSLARASGVEPKLSPSFLSGTEKILEFEDGDVGFDTDLDVYEVAELRALLRTSRRLLEKTRVPVSRTFRAGGYLGTPKMLQAIRDEKYIVDSSAIDYRQLDELKGDVLPERLEQIWPNVDPTKQPFLIQQPGPLLEMPIAAVTDYASTDEIVSVFESAHAQLSKDPGRDVFVVLAFHLENAAEFAGRLGEAMVKVRARKELADELLYTTVEKAAELARIRM